MHGKYSALKNQASHLKRQLAAKSRKWRRAMRKRHASARRHLRAHNRRMRAQRRKMRHNRRYHGHIRLGHHMYGGPRSKPAHKMTRLEKYQKKQFYSKRSTSTAASRSKVVRKMHRLLKSIRVPEITFLKALLRERGVKHHLSTKAVKKQWSKAKKWFSNFMFKIWLKKQAAKKAAARAKKAAAAKKRANLKNLDKEDYSKLSKAEANRLMVIENVIHDQVAGDDNPNLSGDALSTEFFGCVDCDSEGRVKNIKPYEHDTADNIAKLSAYSADMKKKIKAIGRPEKKSKKKAKKLTKKQRAARRNARKNAHKKNFKKFMSKFRKTLNYKNSKLVAHLLDRYRVWRDDHDVDVMTKDLVKRLKDRMMEKKLSAKEREVLVTAKVEALEMAVASENNIPTMVRSLRHPYSVRSRRMPSLTPPKRHHDPHQLQRDTDIAFGDGYLNDNMKSERHDIDNAREMEEDAQDQSDGLLKDGFTDMEKTPVWEKFDGPGGDHKQIRANKINRHRKRYPNKPLKNGKSPW